MAERSTVRKHQKVAEEVLGAMMSAFQETIATERKLTDVEFYALKCAFVAARRHLSKTAARSFLECLFPILDMDLIRAGEGEYYETYESLIESLVP